MTIRQALLLALGTLVAACGSSEQSGNSAVREVTVASYKRPCTDLANRLCFQTKKSDETSWQNFYGAVSGFQYQWGHEYDLLVRETLIANPPADGGSVDTELLSLSQVRADAVGTEYLLDKVTLDVMALSINQAGNYQLYGEPFACAVTVDCATLFSLNGSNRVVAMRFKYTGVAPLPIELLEWR